MNPTTTHHILTKEFAEDPSHERTNSQHCAVANLLRKELGFTGVTTVSPLFAILIGEKILLTHVPTPLREWIRAFDRGEAVSTIEFDLTWGNL